jgi:ATP-dependent DNA ligase
LQAVKCKGRAILYSRRKNILNKKFDYVAEALDFLPDETVIDGELVALGPDGKPNFNLLQNFRSSEAHIIFYVFDILIHKGRELMSRPLAERRSILAGLIKPTDHVGISQVSDKTAAQMLKFVKSHGLEGVVAKRAESVYQPGLRTGLWSKHRINLGQEFVIGGYIPSHLGLDSIVIGVYRGKDLYYAARVRAGFVPAPALPRASAALPDPRAATRSSEPRRSCRIVFRDRECTAGTSQAAH